MQDACVSTEDDDFMDLDDEDEDEVTERSSKTFSYDDLIECLDSIFDAFLKRIFRKYSPIIPKMAIYKELRKKIEDQVTYKKRS